MAPRANAETLAAVRITTIVVTYGHEDEIAECLDALLAQVVDGGHQVVVVDNASPDRTAAVLERYAERVDVVLLPENVGYARAHNLVIQRARGRFVALVNPDCRPQPDALALLAEHLEKNPGVGAAASMLLFPDGSRQHFARREPALAQVFWDLCEVGSRADARWRGGRGRAHRRYARETDEAVTAFSADCPAAACVVLWRDLVRERVFDERYPLVFNDADLYRRLRDQGGYDVHVVPTITAVHFQGTSLGRLDRDRLRAEFVASLCRYASRNWSLTAAAALRLLVVVDAIACWALAATPRSHRARLRAQARGDLGGLGLGRTHPWLVQVGTPRERATAALRATRRRGAGAASALSRRARIARLRISLARARVLGHGRVDLTVHPTARLGRVRLDVRGRSAVRLEAGSVLHDGVLLRLWGGELTVGRRAEVRHDAALTVKGELTLGPRTSIGRGANVHADGTMTWGFGATTAEHVTVVDSEHLRDDSPLPVFDLPTAQADVHIGAAAFIGAKAVVTAGVTVGAGAVVAAGAVATRDVPAGSRVGGVPARPLRPSARRPT